MRFWSGYTVIDKWHRAVNFKITAQLYKGEGNGNPLQYSCLGNPMDRGAWWATAHGIPKELDRTERLHFHFSLSCTGEGNGSPLQCSCLENPRDGGAWRAAVYGVAQSRTQLKWLSSSSSFIRENLRACSVVSDCNLQLFETLWTIARQAPLSMGFSHGLGCHFLLQGIFPTPGSNLHLLHWQVLQWQVDSLPLPPGNPKRFTGYKTNIPKCY